MPKLTILTSGLCLIAGGLLGYYVRGLTQNDIVPSAGYYFDDQMSDPRMQTIHATGTWSGTNLASPINTATIFCDGINKTCEMDQADVAPFGGTTMLSLHRTYFRISQTDAKTITATSESALCVRQMLVIDREAKTVSFVRTRISKEAACAFIEEAPFTMSLGSPWKMRR